MAIYKDMTGKKIVITGAEICIDGGETAGLS
jgi:hypothetical protein